MLESVKNFDNVIFKNHPAVDIKRFGELPKNIIVSNHNMYELFKNTKLVIGTASGSSVEAVACGISVIIIASQNNLTANSLVEHGKGKIWNIVFEREELEESMNALLEFRRKNPWKINSISTWYKYNFFSPLTDFNIRKTFKF
jgi:spore coat polysaccharide biosynthesis predicted glycosyltransferase SpsG